MDPWLTVLRTRLVEALEKDDAGAIVPAVQVQPSAALADLHGAWTPPGAEPAVGVGPSRPGWSPHVRFPVQDMVPDLRRALAAAWTEAGRREHVSIATYARFVLQLGALGAPAPLVVLACAAQADEVRHAQQCFSLASVYAGQPMGPGLLPPQALATVDATPEQVLVDVLRQGALGETLAATTARAAAVDASVPEVRAVLEHIADDEVRHAALGWRTARWMLRSWPELRPVAERELSSPPHDRHRAVPTGAEHHGFLSAALGARVTAATWRGVIGPCIAVLLGRAGTVDSAA